MFEFSTVTRERLQKLVVEMAVLVCIGVLLGLGVNQFRGASKVVLVNIVAPEEEDLSKQAVMQELTGLNPITPDLAYAKMQAKEVLFVDSRHPIEYNKSHIRGAVNLPYEFFMEHMEAFLEQYVPETILVVYCSGKNCEQSRHLGEELVFAGYTTVYYLEPSWSSWVGTNKPITFPGR